MNKKTPYNPNDIEQLLLKKSYEQLTQEEKVFADSQVDSSAEYNEMRATLISIKHLAQEESVVEVSPQIKEDLMKMMEEKANRAPWYTWNGIAAFLFPTNTPLYKKPGLQFAVMGLLLLFVVNIGLNEFNTRNNQLAINTEKKVEKLGKKLQKEKTFQEPTSVEEEKTELNEEKTAGNGVAKNENKEFEDNIVPPAPVILDEKMDDEMEGVFTEEKIVAPVVVKDLANAKKSINATETTVLRGETTATPTFNNTTSSNVVTLSDVEYVETEKSTRKKKATAVNSQSLSGQEAVIDLLFVAL